MITSSLSLNLYGLVAVVFCFSEVAVGQIDLEDWKLTLPIGKKESPTEVKALVGYRNPPYFFRRSDGAYVFVTPAGGVSTSGSGYPRTELREMNGKSLASWSTTKGKHTMTFNGIVQRMGKVKPDIVVGQIHDSEDDVLQIRFRRGQAQIVWANDDKEVVADPNYKLGTRFTVKIVAARGKVVVYYNDMTKPAASFKQKSSGCYFKVGNYLQTNPSKGESPREFGEVWLYSAKITHS